MIRISTKRNKVHVIDRPVVGNSHGAMRWPFGSYEANVAAATSNRFANIIAIPMADRKLCKYSRSRHLKIEQKYLYIVSYYTMQMVRTDVCKTEYKRPNREMILFNSSQNIYRIWITLLNSILWILIRSRSFMTLNLSGKLWRIVTRRLHEDVLSGMAFSVLVSFKCWETTKHAKPPISETDPKITSFLALFPLFLLIVFLLLIQSAKI